MNKIVKNKYICYSRGYTYLVEVDMKNILITIGAFMLFIILLPVIFLFTTKDGTVKSPDKFKLSQQDIIFNKKVEGEPAINIYISDDKKVVTLNLEDYVRGVVAGEMPANFSYEAIKAQAVAARTYAAAHMEEFGGSMYNKKIGANLTDTTANQVYITKEERYSSWPKDKADEYWSKITKAVEETRLEVLTYDGKLVMAPYYFSTSGGKTENALDVFAKNIPYLRSVDSGGEQISNRYTSTKKFSYKDFVNIISKNYKDTGLSVKNLKSSVRIIQRSEAGGVMKIKLGNITLTGRDIRTLFTLNSTDFTLEFNGEAVFKCLGYGHRVGMSQWGANVMAIDGKNYSEILKHYYTGVKIEKLDKLNKG